jgi:hypothetical protein
MTTSIDVFKDFPKDKYNPLITVMTITQISPLHKVAVNVVSISPDVSDQDVYDLKGARALAKKGLMKILAATNGQVREIKKVSPWLFS